MSVAKATIANKSLGTKIIYAVVLLTCLRVWIGPITIIPTAQAQIPDSGKQLYTLITQAKHTNTLLNEIKQMLKSDTINVRVIDADK